MHTRGDIARPMLLSPAGWMGGALQVCAPQVPGANTARTGHLPALLRTPMRGTAADPLPPDHCGTS